MKILIVDDEELILVGWKYALMSAGYSIETASNGAEAVRKAREQRPDVIIADSILPGMSGLETYREISAEFPDVRVVFVSGHPGEIEYFRKEIDRRGVKCKVLMKPLSREEIVDAVDMLAKQ